MRHLFLILTLAAFLMISPHLINAQFDDLYAVPVKRTITVEYDYSRRPQQTTRTIERTEIIEETIDDRSGGRFDDGFYSNEYYDEYDLGYTHRIQRFHRPVTFVNNVNTWGWYDPFWDPMWGWGRPGITIAFNTGWGWNRWNRWNNWGCPTWGWNNWGWNNWGWNNWGWNNWNAGWGWNDWGWNRWNTGWGWNAGWGGGWGNNIFINNYYGNNWNNGWNNNGWNNNGNNNNVVYGSRRSSSTVSGTRGRVDSPRLVGQDPNRVDTKVTDAATLTSLRSGTTDRGTRKDNELAPVAESPRSLGITGRTSSNNPTQSSGLDERNILRGEDPRTTSRSSIYSRGNNDASRYNDRSNYNRNTSPATRTESSPASRGNTRSDARPAERTRIDNSNRSSGGFDSGSRSTAPATRSNDRSTRGSSPSMSSPSSRSSSPSSGGSMRSSGGGSSGSGSMRSSGGSGGSSRSSGGGSSRRGG